MNVFLRRYREIILGSGIFISYFLLRLLNLSSLPIFTDEAIYLRWAQIALHDANWRFISLTDGKQPLYIWIVMIAMKVISDPILAGRMVSVGAGFFTLIGLWLISYELFKNKRIAYLAAILYVVYPFAQVNDRMALYDSMVGALAIWSLYFSILLVRLVRLDIAYSLGMIMGGGLLTKSSGVFNLILLPITFLLFPYEKRIKKGRLLKLLGFSLFAVLISQVIYSILRLSPFYGVITEKNATFVYPFSEWIKHPLSYFIDNLFLLSRWFYDYFTITYIFLVFISIVTIKQYWREKLVLFLYFIIPFIVLALFGKALFPRLIFFMTLSLLPLTGWGLNFFLERLKFPFLGKNVLAFGFILFFILFPLYMSFVFIIDPARSPITESDSRQYVNNWTAGWGVKESIEYLKNESKNKKIFVGTEGTFGLMPFALELYLVENKNITIRGYWPVKDTLPEEALHYAKKMPAYFIFYQPEHVILSPQYPLELIFKKKEGNSDFYFRLYKFTTIPHSV